MGIFMVGIYRWLSHDDLVLQDFKERWPAGIVFPTFAFPNFTFYQKILQKILLKLTV